MLRHIDKPRYATDILYAGWRIFYQPKAVCSIEHDWTFYHDSFDPTDSENLERPLYAAGSLEEAIELIDMIERQKGDCLFIN